MDHTVLFHVRFEPKTLGEVGIGMAITKPLGHACSTITVDTSLYYTKEIGFIRFIEVVFTSISAFKVSLNIFLHKFIHLQVMNS